MVQRASASDASEHRSRSFFSRSSAARGKLISRQSCRGVPACSTGQSGRNGPDGPLDHGGGVEERALNFRRFRLERSRSDSRDSLNIAMESFPASTRSRVLSRRPFTRPAFRREIFAVSRVITRSDEIVEASSLFLCAPSRVSAKHRGSFVNR